MPTQDINALIEQARETTIQERGDRQEVFAGRSTNVWGLEWMARANDLIAPWWSRYRDRQLREFWKKPDHLAGAIYTLTSKMSAVSHKVIPKDTSIKAHVEQAENLTMILVDSPEFGEGGWVNFFQKWTEELVTQDNGAFGEIIGFGDPTGPIIGRPLSIAHLDSFRCTRTGNSVWPVVYQDTDGKLYKLHSSRVIISSQMSSPIAEMYGVGVCGISRCLNVSQNLLDIAIFKQEKLGSRPMRELLITKGGLDPMDLVFAFQKAEEGATRAGLRRYAKVVIGGSATLPDADVEQIPLSELPDGFDEQSNTIFGMATIALALGMDARELFPAMQSGATRADALIQHLKQRGKGPGQIMQSIDQQLNSKYLPPHLKHVFDEQDDAEDRQSADIRLVRANRRVQDSTTMSIPQRVLREQMLTDGDVNYSQFERMELEDGRLADGTDVLALFYKKTGKVAEYLDIGVEDPLDIEQNDIEDVLAAIQDKKRDAMTDLVNSPSQAVKWEARQALSALMHLETRYVSPDVFAQPLDTIPTKPGAGVDPRARNIHPANMPPNAVAQQVVDAQNEANSGHPTDDKTTVE